MQALHDSVAHSADVPLSAPVFASAPQGRRARYPLTDVAVRNEKPSAKRKRVYDTGGLYLEIFPTGSKLWRWKYRFNGKEKRLALGAYPAVGLKEARSKRDDARKLLDDGIDPSAQKQAVKTARLAQAANTFEGVAREWFELMMSAKAKSHRDKVIARLENDVFPWLGKLPVANITAPEVLACLRRIEDRGAKDTAHRAKQNCSQVFNYAVASGRAQSNPTAYLGGALAPAKAAHFAAVTEPKEVGPLLRKMQEAKATYPVKCALRLLPYLFCRPGELRTMRWDEVHLDAAEWRYIVAKTQTPHVVPLASQVVAVLRELFPLTGRGEFVFPGRDDRAQPMSQATINRALQRAGISTRKEQTGHGFRPMARTILHERLRFPPEVIEHQLAHRVPDALGQAYNRTRFLDDRRRMMQQWADYLDRLRDGGGNDALTSPQVFFGAREGR
ncbi:integrase arm-type DNA-binding domain-containing protein [Paraburkholderia sp. CNPSo 3272]|uniref:tyrosine-type recombinase/integrase n=1 Tax=Paraburkholderia sp. CNPSo 3272 TaxID=2940931 RepID=UPI0020B8D548|nr:integrase arm-type DNA-binding domain-containing protein [Paraburkholderia sp. CNPSo 3272]MCP3728398.1 integrase arm-type DNA-binding domain-containing protein [Paraburkholderia sp. CNPSo 3272]